MPRSSEDLEQAQGRVVPPSATGPLARLIVAAEFTVVVLLAVPPPVTG